MIDGAPARHWLALSVRACLLSALLFRSSGAEVRPFAQAPPPIPSAEELHANIRAQLQAALPGQGVTDNVFLVSTRRLGSRCDEATMAAGLVIQSTAGDASGFGDWSPASTDDLFATGAQSAPTIIFVHGNRVHSGADKRLGELVYRRLTAAQTADHRFRYIIWSWPAAPIPGPIRDYRVKAARTDPAAWPLAWLLQRLDPRLDVGLIGYSYGARVVNGAIHFNEGGQLRGLAPPSPEHRRAPSIRALLIAAAVDADWLLPRREHGNTLAGVERMILLVNPLDPAMRWYRFSTRSRRAMALGYAGLPVRRPSYAHGIVRTIDVSGGVGRSHFLAKYVALRGNAERAWREILFADAVAAPIRHTVGHGNSDGIQQRWMDRQR